MHGHVWADQRLGVHKSSGGSTYGRWRSEDWHFHEKLRVRAQITCSWCRHIQFRKWNNYPNMQAYIYFIPTFALKARFLLAVDQTERTDVVSLLDLFRWLLNLITWTDLWVCIYAIEIARSHALCGQLRFHCILGHYRACKWVLLQSYFMKEWAISGHYIVTSLV